MSVSGDGVACSRLGCRAEAVTFADGGSQDPAHLTGHRGSDILVFGQFFVDLSGAASD